MKPINTTAALFALTLGSWLMSGCQLTQAPEAPLPSVVVQVPEAVVPEPSPVIEPPATVLLEPTPPEIVVPTPADNRELDRRIAQSYINSARQKQPQNSATGRNSSVASALIQKGVAELRSGQTAVAKATLMQAQTLDSSNAVTYLYLSEVAIRENRPAEAQGLAQRGLLFSGSSKLNRGLWKMIQISAQMQGNSSLASQAALKANQS